MSLPAELILSGNEADKLAPRAAIAILGNIPNADAATCLLFLGSSYRCLAMLVLEAN